MHSFIDVSTPQGQRLRVRKSDPLSLLLNQYLSPTEAAPYIDSLSESDRGQISMMLHQLTFLGVNEPVTTNSQAAYACSDDPVISAIQKKMFLVELLADSNEIMLEDKRPEIRSQIQGSLNKIVAEEKAQTRRIELEHQQRSDLGKGAAYAKALGAGLGDGLKSAFCWLKEIGDVVSLQQNIFRVLLASHMAQTSQAHRSLSADKIVDQYQIYYSTLKSLNYRELVEAMGFDPSKITAEKLASAYEITRIVMEDKELRHPLQRFSKDYITAQHPLEVTRFSGSIVFELVLTVILIALTAGAGVVASAGIKTRLLVSLKKLGELFGEYARLVKAGRLGKLKPPAAGSGQRSKITSSEGDGTSVDSERGRNDEGAASDGVKVSSTSNLSRPGWNEPWQPPKNWNGPVNNGKWTGPKGNSSWVDDRPEVARIVGTDPVTGKTNPIIFYKGRVEFSDYAQGNIEVKGLVGTKVDNNADMKKIMTEIANEKEFLKSNGEPNLAAARRWLKNADDGFGGKGLAPHHSGKDLIEYVPKDLHKVQHTDLTH